MGKRGDQCVQENANLIGNCTSGSGLSRTVFAGKKRNENPLCVQFGYRTSMPRLRQYPGGACADERRVSNSVRV